MREMLATFERLEQLTTRLEAFSEEDWARNVPFTYGGKVVSGSPWASSSGSSCSTPSTTAASSDLSPADGRQGARDLRPLGGQALRLDPAGRLHLSAPPHRRYPAEDTGAALAAGGSDTMLLKMTISGDGASHAETAEHGAAARPAAADAAATAATVPDDERHGEGPGGG